VKGNTNLKGLGLGEARIGATPGQGGPRPKLQFEAAVGVCMKDSQLTLCSHLYTDSVLSEGGLCDPVEPKKPRHSWCRLTTIYLYDTPPPGTASQSSLFLNAELPDN
jgi:hypothetical protein